MCMPEHPCTDQVPTWRKGVVTRKEVPSIVGDNVSIWVRDDTLAPKLENLFAHGLDALTCFKLHAQLRMILVVDQDRLRICFHGQVRYLREAKEAACCIVHTVLCAWIDQQEAACEYAVWHGHGDLTAPKVSKMSSVTLNCII